MYSAHLFVPLKAFYIKMEEKKEIAERVRTLRTYMQEKGLQAFIFPSTDPHCGEYVPEHWMTRQWISGFDGSAGTAVVTLEDAALWTDSRYFIAAADQLDGTPFRLMKDGLEETPTITEWIDRTIKSSKSKIQLSTSVGINGWVNMMADVRCMMEKAEKAGLQLYIGNDPAD